MFIAESNLNMLSPTGKSRMWDAGADGYARGEGVACVILKRLSDAISDGDNIECVIRETGVNQDGRTPGITMPSSSAQVALIRKTYAKAGLDLRKKSDRCQYFEAHGTGTKAGDYSPPNRCPRSMQHTSNKKQVIFKKPAPYTKHSLMVWITKKTKM